MKMMIVLMMLAIMGLSSFAQTSEPNPNFKVEIKGKGDPMILIPGLTCSGAVWEETVSKFEQKYECHILSLAGFAGTPAVDYGDSFTQTMTDAIIEYIKSKNLRKSIIVGHSLGGFIALKIASQEPKLLNSTVIVDALPFLPAIMVPSATLESAKLMAENMRKAMMSPMDESFQTRQKAMLKNLIIDEDNIETALSWMLNSDQKTTADAMYELYSTDLRASISAVEIPVLVLGAYISYKNYGVTRESNIASYTAQYSQAKNVTIDMTDKGNHFIMWDDPEFLHTQMKQFLYLNK